MNQCASEGNLGGGVEKGIKEASFTCLCLIISLSHNLTNSFLSSHCMISVSIPCVCVPGMHTQVTLSGLGVRYWRQTGGIDTPGLWCQQVGS